MKTIKIENIEIDDYEAFYEGFHTEEILGGEYDRKNKWLKLTLTDESTISEENVRNYLANPKLKIVLTKPTFQEELQKIDKRIKVLKETQFQIQILAPPECKEVAINFVKSKDPDFRDEPSKK